MFSPNGIRAIFFDLDGTLRHSRPSFHEASCDFAVRLGLSDSAESRSAGMRWLHHYWAQSPELVLDLEKYGERKDLFWTNHARLFLGAFGCSEEQAAGLAVQLYRCLNEEFEPEDWISPDVPETLQLLKEAGFMLAVVSNRTEAYQEELERLGISQFFDFSVAAGVIQSWKPEPGIFHHALELSGTKPEDTLYVGDNYYADVLGAQGVQIQAVLIDPDGIFPEADCAVIKNLAGLKAVLEK